MDTSATASAMSEMQRLAALRRYDILDTPPDVSFDHITALASQLFAVPIAVVSLVDTDRIWFKSHHGLDVSQVDRSPGLCASAILGDVPYVVSDAAHDPRTIANPLVAGAFGLRFYAGVPLRTQDGHNLGTLCVIDFKPRMFSDHDVSMLQKLAIMVMDQMELRLSARNAVVEVSRSLDRAQMLAREVDHRVMNSLQLIVGMLNMQAQASAYPDAARELDVAARRIRNVARVHRHFYLDDAIDTTHALDYLRRLCADFGDVLGGATISVDGAAVTVATVQIMPLGIIVNELATNAAKCGASHIALDLQKAGDGLVLCVRDNGGGLPAGFDPAVRKGLGMRVINMLLRQMEATLEFGPNDDGCGACFRIAMPQAMAPFAANGC